MMGLDRPSTKFGKKERKKEVGQMTSRYRRGQAPTWLGDDSEEEEISVFEKKGKQVEIQQVSDKRLERLNQVADAAPRRRVREADVIEEITEEKPKVEADEEDEFQQRRARARAKAMEPQVVEEDSDDGSSSYEEVTCSESEEEQTMTVAKPQFFVSKTDRITHLEARREQAELEDEARRRKEINEKRTAMAKGMVITDIKRQEEADQNNDAESDGDMPDDSDDINVAEARELWKLRELQRISRYKKERQQQEAERIEVERRRNLTDDQRKLENIQYELKRQEMGLDKRKVKWNHMQKYFHKGAYFQQTVEKGMEAEALYRRDFGEATGADRSNKEMLPAAMQKRGDEFGKAGQSKHTHLTDVDTTYQKDNSGGLMENPFITNAVRSNVATSGNHAFQSQESHMFFKHAKVQDTRAAPIGSASYGTAGTTHKDNQMERPSKRK
eukprot:TRINITY_DN18038_c0_g1_i1.p1 TRINITY_DN18038_c0_g1~~TRINITY_DN18038_c0_g1_i1.p1  ORF type:complete len:466 (+),score=133.41 TRINITY_DN18038_c0_g1_i1:70-1398(+)